MCCRNLFTSVDNLNFEVENLKSANEILIDKLRTLERIVKGGESSSQFQWFTIAKTELQFLIFFVLILGLQLQRYSRNTKRCPPEKKFLETLSFVLPAKTTVGLMV